MSIAVQTVDKQMSAIHRLGVTCGLVAGVWLGAAEAPTKLVSIGLSPFAISLCMVAGVFTARWTFPTLLKGTSYVWADLMSKKHLIVWALLAGALWAVANTLTVFAIRDVGLAIAFPLWNANTLVGLIWARVLFRELGRSRQQGALPRCAGLDRHRRSGYPAGLQQHARRERRASSARCARHRGCSWSLPDVGGQCTCPTARPISVE